MTADDDTKRRSEADRSSEESHRTRVQSAIVVTRTLALGGIIGPLLFTALVLVQGLLQPDYSHLRQPISALAAWPAGWIQNLNFYVTGALTIAFALALHNGVGRTKRGHLGFALLTIGGSGLLWAGIFPWRMIDGVPTLTRLHPIGAIMAFAGTGLGFIVFSRRLLADPRVRDLAAYMMYTGIAMLLLFITIGVFAIGDATPLHQWVGLLQRILCAVWFTCMIVLGVRLRAVHNSAL